MGNKGDDAAVTDWLWARLLAQKRMRIEMLMNKEQSRFGTAMLALMLGLIVGLTLGRGQRPTNPAVPETTQASPAGGVRWVERQEVRTQGLSIARAARRGLKLLPRADRVAQGSLWAVSILVIVIYLLNSFAQPESGTVAPSVQSLSYDPVPTPALSVRLLETNPQGSISAVQYALARWADTPGTWRFSDLNVQKSSYREGEYVPFMLRIESAVPGTTYAFGISYDCTHSGGNGFDFLSSYDRDLGVAPALHEEGPGTSVPDAALPVPDDPSIPFDDGESDRTFKLWGGSFASSAAGPSPASLCLPERGQKAEKTYIVPVTAQAETVYLLWSGHLASSLDWGVENEAESITGTP